MKEDREPSERCATVLVEAKPDKRWVIAISTILTAIVDVVHGQTDAKLAKEVYHFSNSGDKPLPELTPGVGTD